MAEINRQIQQNWHSPVGDALGTSSLFLSELDLHFIIMREGKIADIRISDWRRSPTLSSQTIQLPPQLDKDPITYSSFYSSLYAAIRASQPFLPLPKEYQGGNLPVLLHSKYDPTFHTLSLTIDSYSNSTESAWEYPQSSGLTQQSTNPNFEPYLFEINKRIVKGISEGWNSGAYPAITLWFTLDREGNLENIFLKQSDRGINSIELVSSAVKKSAPFHALPANNQPSHVILEFKCDGSGLYSGATS